jgi:hypothetical protein
MRVTDHPEYSVWQGMKRRCDNPNFKQFHQYGGRGIKVCDRWLNDFHAFLSDMGPRPSPFHTIDRIDVDKGYSPENCRWATRREQARNRRVTQYVEIFGHKYLAVDVALTIGVKTETIIKRANRGLSSEQILWPEKIEDRSGLALGGLANGERQRARTHCKHGHPFDADNTSWTPKGTRTCKTCHRNKMRRIYAKRRGEEVTT